MKCHHDIWRMNVKETDWDRADELSQRMMVQ